MSVTTSTALQSTVGIRTIGSVFAPFGTSIRNLNLAATEAAAAASCAKLRYQSYRQNQRRSLTTTRAAKMAEIISSSKSSELTELLANRRSYYKLKASSPISDSKIRSIAAAALEKVPSAFNSQTVRLVVALNTHHQQIWDTTGSILRNKIGEERYNGGTKAKIDGFRNAYGTVLFYTDPTDVEANKQKFKSYADQFEPWAEQTQGMHQLAIWVGLEAEGLGANLQHYNPVIDGDLAKLFDVPSHWQLRAQLVFGEIEGGRPDEKEKKPLSETLKVFGASS